MFINFKFLFLQKSLRYEPQTDVKIERNLKCISTYTHVADLAYQNL